MARRGGAERLTGRLWATPELRARSWVYRGVIERGGAQRPFGPAPVAFAWPSAPAPVSAASVARGSRGLPLPRTWPSLANDCCAAMSWSRTGRRHRDVSRPQGRHHRLSANTISRVIEPQDVCGAATWCWDRQVAIQPAHVARGRRRRDQHRGKEEPDPLFGKVCLLTTGGLPRNCSSILIRVRCSALIPRRRSSFPAWGSKEHYPSPRSSMDHTDWWTSRSKASWPAISKFIGVTHRCWAAVRTSRRQRSRPVLA
jgi:hypothetical protein